MRVFKGTSGISNTERMGHILSMVGENSAAECFRDHLVWRLMLVGACGEVFAKGVGGKEKDVNKSYFRDAGGFVGWDYTSEENTST